MMHTKVRIKRRHVDGGEREREDGESESGGETLELGGETLTQSTSTGRG